MRGGAGRRKGQEMRNIARVAAAWAAGTVAAAAWAGQAGRPRDANAPPGGQEGIRIIRAGRGEVFIGRAGQDGGVRAYGEMGRWAAMKDACKLTDQQDTKIKEIVKRYWDKRRQWYASDEAKKSRELYQKLASLSRRSDEASKKQAEDVRKQLAKLRARQQKLADDEEADVLGLLTPKQRAAWETHSLAQRMRGWLAALSLSEGQQKKVTDLVGKSAFRYVDLKDLSGRAKLDDQLLDQIAKDILDADQAARLKELRQRRGNTGWFHGTAGDGPLRPGTAPRSELPGRPARG